MKKADVQQLYQDVKRTRRKRRPVQRGPQNKKDCRTCGKVTWKPYN